MQEQLTPTKIVQKNKDALNVSAEHSFRGLQKLFLFLPPL